MKKVNVVIPVFNESRFIQSNLETILQSINQIEDIEIQLVIVDDGSTDDTLQYLEDFASKQNNVCLISLTRNFGKESALLAGLNHSRGDAVIAMDCDLQHPPELIEKMIQLWLEGYDVVEAYKSSRGVENINQNLLARSFYKLFALLTNMDLKNLSDFKLLDKKVVQVYCSMPERKRFFRGLIAWMGFSSARINFEVPNRSYDQSNWTKLKLIRLSIDALSGFTSTPLYLITILGLFSFILSVVIGSMALYDKIIGQAVSGFTTVVLLILLIGSFIMFGLGLIGIYLGQIFKEVKQRPSYIINQKKSLFK